MQANSTYSCVKRMRRVVFRGLGGGREKSGVTETSCIFGKLIENSADVRVPGGAHSSF